jgi:hypothetical protein
LPFLREGQENPWSIHPPATQGEDRMFDELERLRDSADLIGLLEHYAGLAGPDRQAWHDRRMQLDGCEAKQLTRLHGELLAYGFLEQNTGVVPVARKGEAPGCYRVTRAGIKALEKVRSGEED